jgi:excisionase family DNA binding protein
VTAEKRLSDYLICWLQGDKKSMATATLEPIAYGVKDSAKLMGVCPGTIRNLIKDGDLLAVRVRDRVLIRKESLEQLLKEGAR